MKFIAVTGSTLVGLIAWLLGPTVSLAEPPGDLQPQIESVQEGVRLTLVAQHPDIVTPTGIDVDSAGRIWAVASHTHFRPDDYDGPEHDEVVVFSEDGSARSVFYDQTDATMDLELSPHFESDGWVYLAQRDCILRVRDRDGDGRGDQRQDLAVLQTTADYPHNGLSGLAWHPSGDLIFALGENYWTPWTLTGSDGARVRGTGEGGVFRCKPDGTSLRRIARGFWNPFGICVREDGTMFAAENDPGARPPCRLLHLVDGGDYGYQRLYGNAPYHPFVCWDGELRGTLPMLHGLGEAPCGIAPLGGGLVVTSWTDHRIDFYPLTPSGASFVTERVTLLRGGEHFRPTCLAQHSATVFYLTDWVFGSYQLHSRGRVWRLEIDPSAAPWLHPMTVPPATASARTATALRVGGGSFSDPQLLELARGEDPFIGRAAIDALARRVDSYTEESVAALSEPDRISMLLALRQADPDDADWVRFFLQQPGEEIRFETLRWIADAGLQQFAPDVESMLTAADMEYRIFEACLATWNTLAGNPRLGVADPEMLMSRIADPEASPRSRAFALRLLDPAHKEFASQLWQQLLDVGDPLLTKELTRALAAKGTIGAQQLLARVAEDPTIDLATRGDAVAGLSAADDGLRHKLIQLAESPQATLREEALRSLRFSSLSSNQRQRIKRVAEEYPESSDLAGAVLDAASVKQSRPSTDDIPAWRQRLAAIEHPIDHEAGRRIFHHASVGTCVKCHRYRGRGMAVGPDLSAVSSAGDPDRLLRALLQPSRDVDPQYFPRALVTEDGQVFTGILLRDGGGGKEYYRDSNGRERMFLTPQIVQRTELRKSMMPDGLGDLMTDREIRDLLAFLDASRSGVDRTLVQTESPAARFVGDWWLDFDDGYGGWISIDEGVDGLDAELLWRVGSPRPLSDVTVVGDQLVLQRRRRQQNQRFVAALSDGEITIELEGSGQVARGRRCPPMPPRPDLTSVRFGRPIELFNGNDLSGWQLQPADARNGWSAKDGQLVNETPKVDFSSYGEFGNLRTTRVFGDCQLHIEFNVGPSRNSGVYVRGLYEAQVVDRDSPMQGISGPGAVFGRVAPTRNAGLPGGQWQTYDITLVDRHITIELNGEKVIDNQPVAGCTGGALLGDVSRDGPVYLQGDHTSVRYRNIRIRPRID